MEIQNCTYVMIKPVYENNDKNKLAQAIIFKELQKRFAQEGLKIEYKKRIKYTKKAIASHYREHVGKHFYRNLERCLLKNSAVGMVVSGKNVIERVRAMAGSTIKVDSQTGNIRLPEPGSIRYNMFIALYQVQNGVKPSDVVIPENLDDCEKVFNTVTNCVDIFKNGEKIAEMNMTENLVHTSSCKEDALNEIQTFASLCKNKSQTLEF